jgi:glutamate synthase domain-containing protein 2
VKGIFSLLPENFVIERDEDRCIQCMACVQQCAYQAHYYLKEKNKICAIHHNCVGDGRCVAICPTDAIRIRQAENPYRPNHNWSPEKMKDLYQQAENGTVLLVGMGAPTDHEVYWDKIVLNASQVTNPSIDPLREPMEVKTFLGAKPDRVEVVEDKKTKKFDLKTKLAPQLELELPIMFSAMSYGSISLNACKSLAKAAWDLGTFWNTGEGGLHKDLYKYGPRTIVQVASGRFGVHVDYLKAAAAVEIKIGQGAKPGIGGHLPGEKVNKEISQTRAMPEGADAISPAPHHDIYSIEDLRQLIYAIKEATDYEKPVSVKISAVHNVAAIASGIVRAGADIVAIDGIRGGTGAAPKIIRDNVGIPIELAIAAVDERLRKEGIRNHASIVAAGGFRNSGDIIKAIALGADAVYVGTSALMTMGCHVCAMCYRGTCNWGIATQKADLTKRLNPEIYAHKAKNLLHAWTHEIQEMLGAMGINSIESLRGNRHHLRAVGIYDPYLSILGIDPAGA